MTLACNLCLDASSKPAIVRSTLLLRVLEAATSLWQPHTQPPIHAGEDTDLALALGALCAEAELQPQVIGLGLYGEDTDLALALGALCAEAEPQV